MQCEGKSTVLGRGIFVALREGRATLREVRQGTGLLMKEQYLGLEASGHSWEDPGRPLRF